jgi:hypothetical protein
MYRRDSDEHDDGGVHLISQQSSRDATLQSMSESDRAIFNLKQRLTPPVPPPVLHTRRRSVTRLIYESSGGYSGYSAGPTDDQSYPYRASELNVASGHEAMWQSENSAYSTQENPFNQAESHYDPTSHNSEPISHSIKQYDTAFASQLQSSHSPLDYDPEHFAPDTTPEKPYSHAHNLFSRSQSATPDNSPLPLRRAPTSGQVGLTRRVLSSSGKENIPPYDTVESRSTSHSYDYEAFVEKEVKASSSSRENQTPLANSQTTHFGLPPRKQRRRYQGGKKIVPLTQ